MQNAKCKMQNQERKTGQKIQQKSKMLTEDNVFLALSQKAIP